ncbi:MAG: hypothetical protein AAGI69_25480 [Cyanobacteria bacterium P01_H01_bin.21]
MSQRSGLGDSGWFNNNIQLLCVSQGNHDLGHILALEYALSTQQKYGPIAQ